MGKYHRLSRFLCVFVFLCWSGSEGLLAATVKPQHTVIGPGQDSRRIAVKFKEGLDVRLRNNALVSTNAAFANAKALFDSLSSGRWDRADAISEEALDGLRQRAEQRTGRRYPDLNLEFYLSAPAGMEAAALMDKLNALDLVELAQPVPKAAPAPLPPNFEEMETNFYAAPLGGGIFDAWTNYGFFGAGIQVADVEYSFNSNHLDLPIVVTLDTNAIDPFNNNNHGTATIGEMAALENGWGTTGAADGASYYFAGAFYTNGYDVGRGITTATAQLNPGDFLLVEQQIDGPNAPTNTIGSGSQYGLVPVEWFEPYYERIQLAVGLGITVIEAAGNGGQNLDDPIYSTGNGGFWPFLATNDSGAILVGAGASTNGSSTERSRLDFSNYGSRIDVQQWGENVVTTGYGDLYDAEGTNLFYTSVFGGTSGAAPVTVGEAVLLESIYTNTTGKQLAPAQIRTLLRNTGTPQTGGAYPAFENIGSMPNLGLAITTALSNSGPPVIVKHVTNLTERIGGTATLGVAAAGAQPMTYQWQFSSANLSDGVNVSGAESADLNLNNLGPGQSGAYTVTVSNAAGVASATTMLSVILDPALTPGVTLRNVYTFENEADGSGPVGLASDGAGDFYGVQQFGGTNGDGGIFEFTPATMTFNVLYSFTGGVDGANPITPLTLGSDGNFYGTTPEGGANFSGTVFSYQTLSGTVQPLYTFNGGPNGGYPEGRLVETNGVFYGTTYYGGTGSGYGVIYSVDSFGDFNLVHSFDYSDGAGPEAGLTRASDGNFYGTTSYGGTNDAGTIFRLASDMTFTSLYSLTTNDGTGPTDDLTQGTDGKLYGRTYSGGEFGFGTIFSITTNGQFELLFSFAGTNGANPNSALAVGSDGNLYGTTQYGGTNDQNGVVYEITPGGAFSVVARFDGSKGINPSSAMEQDVDGNLYGTAFRGGYGYGVIYQFAFGGASSLPQPSFESVNTSGGEILLTASVIAGWVYQLQSATNLNEPDWTPVGGPVTASSPTLIWSDPLLPTGQKFYRAQLVNP